MTLNLAVFVNILYACRAEDVRQAELLYALTACIDENNTYCEDKKNVDNIFGGHRGFPKPQSKKGQGTINTEDQNLNLVPMLRYMSLDMLATQIHDRVLPLLDSDKASRLFLALRHVVREDPTIFKSNLGKFSEWTGCPPTEFAFLQHVDFSRFLAGLYKYSVLVGKPTSGKTTLTTIRSDAFWASIVKAESFVVLDGFGANHPLSDVSSLIGLDSYLHSIRKEYMEVKTFFDWKPYFQFDELFVCSDIKPFGNKALTSNALIREATAPKLASVSPYLILYGTGGMGKSMMLRHLLFDAIDHLQERKVVPFFVCLRYYQHHGDEDLASFILDESKDYWPGLDDTILREILGNGKALILLDGLDEVKTGEAEILRAKLFDMMKKYPDNQYIMSSRPFDNHFRSYSKFRIAEVCGLRVEQIDDLLVRVGYFAKNPDRRDSFKELIRDRMRTDDKAFCENPLLLTFMMLLYEQHRTMPTKRHAFYEQTFSVLFSRHDLSKDGFIRELRSKLTEEEFKSIFAEFCAKTYFREDFEFTRDQFITLVSSLKSWEKVKERTGTDQFLVDSCVNLCIMDQCGAEYKFIHRTFQEYFCACWLSSKPDNQLKEKVAWFEEKKKRTMEDCVFSFLYEMAEERVELNMILPVLESCFKPREGVERGYWSYLMNQYPEIPYVIGKCDDSSFEPQSSILMYILHTNGFFHKDLDADKIPYEELFCEQVYFNLEPHRGYSPKEAMRAKNAYKDVGVSPRIVRRDMLIETEYLHKNRSAFSDVFGFFNSRECPLAVEYLSVLRYYQGHRRRLEEQYEDFRSA